MTQKNKNIILVITFFSILFGVYKFSISKTLSTKNELDQLKARNIGYENMTSRLGKLQSQEKYLDSILDKNNIKNTSIQNNLLSLLNDKSTAFGFQINEFNEPHEVIVNKAKITSYSFTLQGEYEDLERLIYSLERKYSYGNITHLNFERKRDNRSRKNYLNCSVILENLVVE